MKVKEPAEMAQACVIWMHGLGSSAANMLALAEQLTVDCPIRHVCVDAPVRPVTLNNHVPVQAWYDIYGLHAVVREDRAGLLQSQQAVEEVIAWQLQSGLSPHQLFLAGFSQGAAMTLFAGLQSPHALGGLICLSGYLPLASTWNPTVSPQTPVFIALGVHDQVVVPAWTRQSIASLKAHAFTRLDTHEYPMEHTVCLEEIRAISRWLNVHTAGKHTNVPGGCV